MDLGSGVAVAGLCVSGGAVAITALRTFNSPEKTNGKKNGLDSVFPCREHSGLVATLASISQSSERHEEWLKEIAADIKTLLSVR